MIMKHLMLTSAIALLLTITSCGNGNTGSGLSEKSPETPGKPEAANTGIPVLSGGEPVVLTKALFLEKVYDFEKNPDNWVYKDNKPCIIDFYADWCRPCRMVAPIMEEFASKYEGKITIYKVDTDKERELAGYFGIRSIPSVLFCPVKGNPQMTQGALPKEDFQKIINEFLLAPASK